MTDSVSETSNERKDMPLPHGAYAQIARRMRPTVSAEAVRQVWLGRSKSARISAAIERYRQQLLDKSVEGAA